MIHRIRRIHRANRARRLRSAQGAALAMCACLIVACGDSPEAHKARQETGEAVDAIGEYAGKTRAAWTAQLKESLSGVEDEIATLQEQARRTGQELSSDAKEMMAALEIKAQGARESLAKLNENKGEVWQSLAQGAERSFDELKKAVQEARDKVR